ncbi:MAG: PilN domain-containing protein [Alphaproteobacteria bacterium]|nr:PilN domain-containing protein [Alphaproteobacteria bacterium]
MIAAFLTWWMSQLAELLPAGLRASSQRRADAILVRPAGGGDTGTLRFSLRRQGEERELVECRADDPALKAFPETREFGAILRLAPTEILTKELSLPLAAQADLSQVLAFEMDRETPFTAEEVYWTYHIASTDRQRGLMHVALWLVPKSHLAPLLDQLAGVGIVPRWAELEGVGANVILLPLGNERPRLGNSGRLIKPLAIACACLAFAACVTPLIKQSVQLGQVSRELETSKAAMSTAEPLRHEIDGYTRNAGAMDDMAQATARPLDVLAMLTRLLPDDTYLTDIEIRQRKVTLSGRSASAAKLIGLIAADARFRNPTFAAPVTRLAAQRVEVFTIVTELGRPPS